VKRLVLRTIPDPATRLAALKRGEADIAFSMIGELGDEVRRTPGLTVKAAYPSTSSGRRRPQRSIRPAPAGCSPRPDTPTASTPASTSAT
jgi:ABC-type transport system substrate-binding protein